MPDDMTTPFRDRAYVLTGASSGIGFAAAVRLFKGGATVHVVDVPDAEPEFFGAGGGSDLERKGKGKVYYYGGVDVGSRTQVTQTFARIRERSGPRLWGLVNCAGVFGESPLATNGEADDAARRIMDVNFWGAWNAGTEFLKGVLADENTNPKEEETPTTGMKRKRKRNDGNGGVCVVNVASMAALRGMAGAAAYVASKHAVLGLTRSWAQEFGGRGVRVNAVAPGVIRPLAETGGEGRGEGGGMGPFVAAVNRAGEADDVAGAILFLLGSDSGYVSGQAVEVNGGWA